MFGGEAHRLGYYGANRAGRLLNVKEHVQVIVYHPSFLKMARGKRGVAARRLGMSLRGCQI